MFKALKDSVQRAYTEMVRSGKTLFLVDIHGQTLWDVYFNAFDEAHRQENNCSSCRHFIRRLGGLVTVRADGTLQTLWDEGCDDPEYKAPVAVIQSTVSAARVGELCLSVDRRIGVDFNADPKREGVIWNHFCADLPAALVLKGEAIGPKQSHARASAEVLLRGVREIAPQAVETVLELIAQGTLPRGDEYLRTVQGFQAFQAGLKHERNTRLRVNLCWDMASRDVGLARLNNSSMGTLLNDLSNPDMSLEDALRRYDAIMAPANYQRPKAPVTSAMIERARALVQEKGWGPCLLRRRATVADVSAADTLFLDRTLRGAASSDPLDVLQQEVQAVQPKTLSHVTDVSFDELLSKVLPSAKSIELLLEPRLANRMVTLVSPKEYGPSMFKWGNAYSWDYTGNMASADIKRRVKEEGGRVDGVMRISLAWHNQDDLDLHVERTTTKVHGEHLYYGDMRAFGAVLDVDMHCGSPFVPNPVENVCWDKVPLNGEYRVYVHRYTPRETSKQGYTVELEYQGETWTFERASNATSDMVTFRMLDGRIEMPTGASQVRSGQKWGLRTAAWQPVHMVTFSPNHWKVSEATGNKHAFFFLKGCVSDEVTRPFFNEQLCADMHEHRKVFEQLGARTPVEPADNELSGVGFALGEQDHFYARITGAHTRILKVTL